MDKRDLSKYIEAVRETIDSTKQDISKLEQQKKDAQNFQFIKKLCERNFMFYDESCKLSEDELATALKVDNEQLDLLNMDSSMKILKNRLQSCYALIDELQKIQAENN